MALGFDKKVHKSAKAASFDSHQVRGQRQRELLPPHMRSPALEALERDKARRQSRKTGGQRASRARKMRYAVEETLVRPPAARKSLPRLKSANAVGVLPQRTGLTAGWRIQARQESARQDVLGLGGV